MAANKLDAAAAWAPQAATFAAQRRDKRAIGSLRLINTDGSAAKLDSSAAQTKQLLSSSSCLSDLHLSHADIYLYNYNNRQLALATVYLLHLFAP